MTSGALPADTDLDAVIRDLGLDTGEVLDPTQMDGDALVAEIQQTIKALLGYGARIPKELMLFVKNLMFVDGAIATLAPELDILAEIANVTMYFATQHGETIARQLGTDMSSWEFDMDGVKAGFGLGDDVERLTYRDLQERGSSSASGSRAASSSERAGSRRHEGRVATLGAVARAGRCRRGRRRRPRSGCRSSAPSTGRC